MLKRLNQTGDTIVEVLIAISVISLILTAGYAATSASLTAERRSEDRSIVLGILQNQLESLRSASSTPIGISFCFDNTGKLYKTTDTIGSPPKPACGFSSSGANGNATAPIYGIAVSGPVNGVFTATGTWDQAGSGEGTQTLLYKLQ